jgi:hypothetical protein
LLEGACKSVDMSLLVRGDHVEARPNPGGKTSLCERLVSKVGQSLVVERVLKVLKGESVVENVSIWKVAISEGCMKEYNSETYQ